MSPKRLKPSILAGGGVVHRTDHDASEYLVVHRPRYGDWALPKGKLDRGEGFLEAALREVREETGVRANRPVEIGSIGYSTGQASRKVVRWWLMEEAEKGVFAPNREVDEVAWLGKNEAWKRLDYEAERNVLDRADALLRDPTAATIYLIRHGRAGEKATWRGKDARRPLDDKGRRQSIRLAAGLDEHPITRILSSSAQRCIQTVRPLSLSIRLPTHTDSRLGVDANGEQVLALVGELEGESAVLATHGEVIASAHAALSADGVDLDGPQDWSKGSAWVLQASKGRVLSGRYLAPG